MAYIPTTWINNSTPAINATNLNKMETGIDEAHDCANILYTPFGDVIATNVQAAITELENEKISKATLDANSIIKADVDDTPVVLTVATQTLVGRITAGSIDDLSVAQVQTLINVEDGSQETSTAHVNTAGAVMETDYGAQTIIVAVTNDTPVALGVGASELVGRTSGGNIDSLTMSEARAATMLNVADGATLTFEISSPLAVCLNPSVGLNSIPNNNLFLFTRVGNSETADIDCKGSVIGSEGYYRPRKAPYSFTGMDTDQPFGRTLHLFGWFGKLCTIDYYKVQYSTDGGTTWTDIETSLPNKWYDTSDPNPLNWHWVSESMGPFSDGGLDNLYKVPFFVRPDTPWSWLDRVARFNTTLATDGFCRLKIIGYKWSGSSLVEATSSDILVDPNYGEIVLQIDNTPPTVNILDVKLNGVSKPVCDILNFGTSATDEISVSFRVWDQRGHLRNYVLDAMYGHDCYVKPRPTTPDKASDNYENNASGSPSWQGNLSYTTEYIGSDYGSGGASPSTDCFSKTFAQMPANVMPTCAYQFRLHASKRTTNGYGLIYHWVEDTWHVTIQR